jgi:flagellin
MPAAATGAQIVNTLNANAGFTAKFDASLDQSGKLVVASKTGGTVSGGTAALPTPLTAGIGTSLGVQASALDFSTAAKSQTSIGDLDKQISAVSTARAQLGAYQNRLEHTINNVNVSIENLSASESRIRDTDMAQEMMSYTRSQILTQAGTAMLAQANQSQQGVLSLLR